VPSEASLQPAILAGASDIALPTVKESFLLGVASFFVPGLGQLFRGRFLAAIGWLVVVLLIDFFFHWTVFVPVLAHLAAAFDAYRGRPPIVSV